MISNIRGERGRFGFSQGELARRLAVSESLVRCWESGKAKPSGTVLLNMSEMFDCTTDYLLGLSDERMGHMKQPTH